ncbi:iron-containing alcohol dehydrogenase [Acanthopleuribacter pedis]|uniref:Iron-containing alcohol dehydrogenase n=1 Tax=Acanthopleuribacter pedis TaxID=442870 RepID=A0A8J7QDJ6_9BACT|nr:iron-containing alcohol dehydrogenase [Acanthopleuribacter pedis]MBO1317630.1 iron-containing alcohol dehydrogenase [Acanthopleuribacter pedis]
MSHHPHEHQPYNPEAGFDFDPTTHLICGRGKLNLLPETARSLQAGHILLVTDPGLIQAGHAEHSYQLLRDAGFDVTQFDRVCENPTTTTVELGTQFAKDQGDIDLIVALGGGSAMDCAKGINFLLTNGGRMEDYWGYGRAKQPMLPSIGIPTTAGTGSEGQSFALISQEQTHRKMACGDRKARFSAVILDPELLTSLPINVIATTGIDAMTHALESFVCTRRNPLSSMFAREAWRLLATHFETVLNDQNNMDAWGSMQLGAHYAGMAIEHAMLGGAHASGNPLTAFFDVAHGSAVGLMMPHVIRTNQSEVGDLYADLARAGNLTPRPDQSPAEALAAQFEQFMDLAGLPNKLSMFGVEEQHLGELAENAMTQWTGNFNPIPFDKTDFIQLYRNAL